MFTIVGDASGNYEVETNYEYYSGVYGEGDWPYSLLEGDDFLPEVIIGRLSVRTPTHLGVVVNKILNYEKAEDMSEGWYETAALIGDPSDSGISTLFIATIIGTSDALACSIDSIVWGFTPSLAATTRIIMSVTIAPRALILLKAACPGVSRNVIVFDLCSMV